MAGSSAASASLVSGGRNARPLSSHVAHARVYQSASMSVCFMSAAVPIGEFGYEPPSAKLR